MEGTSTRSGKIRGTKSKPDAEKTEEAIATFVNERAIQRHEIMLKRNLSPDRGFLEESLVSKAYEPYITNIIAAHGWEVFCLHEKEAVTPIVKEFYANMPQSKATKVMVRGKSVSFSAITIRKIYSLPTVEDEYQSLKNSTDGVFLKQVLEECCVEGTTWTESVQKSLSFLRSSLKPDARVWYHFLKSRLKPTSHTESVTKERAILLSCILDGRPIDVGRVIQNEISVCAKADTGFLWFPGLITRLCKEAKVPIDDNEEHFTISEPITPHTTDRINKKAKELAGEILPSPKAKGKGVAASTSDPAMRVPTNPTIAWQKRVEDRLRRIEEGQKKAKTEILEKLAEMDKFVLAQLGFLQPVNMEEGQTHAAATEEEGDDEEEEEDEGKEEEDEAEDIAVDSVDGKGESDGSPLI